MKTLTIKELAPYFPYGIETNIGQIERIYKTRLTSKKGFDYKISEIKPILRPLYQLIEEIEHNGKKFIPIVELLKISENITTYLDLKGKKNNGVESYGVKFIDCDMCEAVFSFTSITGFGVHLRDNNEFGCWQLVQEQLFLWQKILEWHFDVFCLLDNDLAIIKQNK